MYMQLKKTLKSNFSFMDGDKRLKKRTFSFTDGDDHGTFFSQSSTEQRAL